MKLHVNWLPCALLVVRYMRIKNPHVVFSVTNISKIYYFTFEAFATSASDRI